MALAGNGPDTVVMSGRPTARRGARLADRVMTAPSPGSAVGTLRRRRRGSSHSRRDQMAPTPGAGVKLQVHA